MSTPTSHPISPQALAGIKVIELGQLIAGPFAGKTLADFGAEVIKIEPPAVDGAPDGSGGDPLRQWRMLHNGTSVWWLLVAATVAGAAGGAVAAIGLGQVRRSPR